jgi:hypothetical protein
MSNIKLDQVFSNCSLSRPAVSKAFLSQSQFVSHDTKLYANDGVFSGISPVIQLAAHEEITVGIIAGYWPGWVYPFSHCSFKVKWILLVGDMVNCFDDVYRQFPHIRVIQQSALRDSFHMGDEVDIIAINGPIQGLAVPPTFAHIALFDWKYRNRGLWDKWSFQYENLRHAACGGTSDFSCYITFGYHSSLHPSFILPTKLVSSSFPACNFSTVTKCTITGKELNGDPNLPSMTRPPSTMTLGRNLFHFKGLHPFDASKPEFILPCVFGRKSKWVRRGLSLEELRDVLDVPVSGMRRRSLNDLLHKVVTPIKVLLAVVNDIFLRVTGG